VSLSVNVRAHSDGHSYSRYCNSQGGLVSVDVAVVHPLIQLPSSCNASVDLVANCDVASIGGLLGVTRSMIHVRFSRGEAYPPHCSASLVSGSVLYSGDHFVLHVSLLDKAGNYLDDVIEASISLFFRMVDANGKPSVLSLSSITINSSASCQSHFMFAYEANFVRGHYVLTVSLLGSTLLHQSIAVIKHHAWAKVS
jgi:hypothetical protein